jgi:hypothetical protein
MLIILMASSHSLGVSGVASDSIFHSKFWLPRGWATDGFVVLCGVTVSAVWDWKKQYSEFRRSLHRKALQLLAVMFLSNVALLGLHYLVTHQIATVLDLSWWIGLFTLATPYSISGVLLPIAVCIFGLPYVRRFGEAVGWIVAFISMIALNALARFTVPQLGATAASVVSFGAGFPIIPMALEGAIGFAGGMLWRWLASERVDKTELQAASLLGMLILPFLPLTVLGQLASTLLPLARVILLVLVGIAISTLPILLHLTGFASLLGRYSLFCFLGHRIIIQSFLPLGHYFGLQPSSLYLGSFVLTLSLLGLLCHIRVRHPGFNSFLQTYYL